MRAWSALPLLAACAHPQTPPKPSCTGLTAEIRARATAAEEFNLRGYRAELERAGLTPVGLPSRPYEGGAGAYDDDPARFHPIDEAFEEGGKQWVGGPLISVPSGQIEQPSFEFVRDQAGTVFRLERKLDVLSVESSVLCGCGPVGSGAAPHAEQVLYELPAGASFGGVKTIAYPVKLYQFTYSGTDERGERCEPPP
jgi:hypothetical protein